MTLQKTILRRAVLLAALLPFTALGTGGSPAKGRGIEGVWDSTVTLTSCQDPTIILNTFRALNLFDRHGSLVATSQVAPPPSLGKWQSLGGRRYRASFRFQRFGASGVFEGLTQVTREIRLAADGDSFTGVVEISLYDVTDVPFASGCGLEAAKRLY